MNMQGVTMCVAGADAFHNTYVSGDEDELAAMEWEDMLFSCNPAQQIKFDVHRLVRLFTRHLLLPCMTLHAERHVPDC